MKRASQPSKDKGQSTKRTAPLRGNDHPLPIRTTKQLTRGSEQIVAMKTDKLTLRGSDHTPIKTAKQLSKGHDQTAAVKTEKLPPKGNDHVPAMETDKLVTKYQASSKSLSTRKASSLSSRDVGTRRSHSASPAASRSVLKRSRLTSPIGRDSPDKKRSKVGSGMLRGRPRGIGLRRRPPSSPREIEKRRIAEMKKLTTTDGFWAASSPAGEGESLQVKRRSSSSKKSSTTTTPDVSPASATRKKSVGVTTVGIGSALQIKSTKSEKEQSAGNIVSELRRLQTTDGFWSPGSILSDSRDASPSSTSSSLERSFRQRSQQKKGIGEVINSLASENQTLTANNTPKVKQKNTSKILVRHSSAPDIVSPEKEVSKRSRSSTSRASFLSNSLKKKSLLRRSPTRFGKQKVAYHRGMLSSGKFIATRRKEKEIGREDVESPLSNEPSEESKRNLRRRKLDEEESKAMEDVKNSHGLRRRHSLAGTATLKAKPDHLKNKKPVVDNANDEKEKELSKRSQSAKISPASSLERRSRKTEVGLKTIMLETRQTRLKTAGDEIHSKASGKEKEVLTARTADETDSLRDLSVVSSSTPNSSSKLAISDLLGSGELKRLDTTPGFWAPTPDVSRVLRLSYNRRSYGSSPRPSRHAAASKCNLSPPKPKSSLLQLRKKKLSALQKQRQIKKQISKEEQQQSDCLHQQVTEDETIKKKRFVFGRKKRKHSKRTFLKEEPLSESLGSSSLNGHEGKVEHVSESTSDDKVMLSVIKNSSNLLVSQSKVVNDPSKNFESSFNSTSNSVTTIARKVESVTNKLDSEDISTGANHDKWNQDERMSELNDATVTYEVYCDKVDKFTFSTPKKVEPVEARSVSIVSTLADTVETISVSHVADKVEDTLKIGLMSKESPVFDKVKAIQKKVQAGSLCNASTVTDTAKLIQQKMEIDPPSKETKDTDKSEQIEDELDAGPQVLKDETIFADTKNALNTDDEIALQISREESDFAENKIEAEYKEKQIASCKVQNESNEFEGKVSKAKVSNNEKEIDEPDSVIFSEVDSNASLLRTDAGSSIVKVIDENQYLKDADSSKKDNFTKLLSKDAEFSSSKDDTKANISRKEASLLMEVLDSNSVALGLVKEMKTPLSTSVESNSVPSDSTMAKGMIDGDKANTGDSLAKHFEAKTADSSIKEVETATATSVFNGAENETVASMIEEESETKTVDSVLSEGIETNTADFVSKAGVETPATDVEIETADSLTKEGLEVKIADSLFTEGTQTKTAESVSNNEVKKKAEESKIQAVNLNLSCVSNVASVIKLSTEQTASAGYGESTSLVVKSNEILPNSPKSSFGESHDLCTNPDPLPPEDRDGNETAQRDQSRQDIPPPPKLDLNSGSSKHDHKLLIDNDSKAFPAEVKDDFAGSPCSSSVCTEAPHTTVHTGIDLEATPEKHGSQIHTGSASLASESLQTETNPPDNASKMFNENLKLIESNLPLPGAVSLVETKRGPLRRVVKRKRNAWKRGILQKVTKIYKKSVQNSQTVPDPYLQKSAAKRDSLVGDREITPLQDQSLVTHSQTLTNTVRNAKKTAKELRKSTILRRLQTDANLAGGSLDDSALHSGGRNLREIVPKCNTIPTLRKELASNVNVIDLSSKPKIRSGRGPGRPRKHKKPRNLPKLILSTKPVEEMNVHRRWYKTPPKLSPQPIERVQTSLGSPDKHAMSHQDEGFVSESVDESDLHLYLSGVSDEEPSPAKSEDGNYLIDAYNPLNLTETFGATERVKGKECDSAGSQNHVYLHVNMVSPQKTGVTKLKGRKGRPPGTPMTEEEKMKVRSNLLARYDDSTNFKRPRTARKSTFTPSLYLTSSVSSSTAKKFSLRQKTTRSPLEMLEIKRKQEEAIYDMEQEKRLAKRINRLEKRFSQASADELFEEDCEDSEWEIKDCAVILNDFVKKLHLEGLDMPPLADASAVEGKRPDSPDYVPSAVDEDWCANLEEFQDDCIEEWTSDGKQQEKRPFIPRLKLKRVPKIGKEKKVKGHKSKKRPKFICPQQDAQQPLKLVIKTEVPSSTNIDNIAKSAPAVDVLNMQRQGFEGSFVDFLRGKTTNEFMTPKLNRASHLKPKSTSPTEISEESCGKETDGVNDGHLILNLGDVGCLKSKSISMKKSSLNSGSAVNSNQRPNANDDMGAMQSSYCSQETQDGNSDNNPNKDNGAAVECQGAVAQSTQEGHPKQTQELSSNQTEEAAASELVAHSQKNASFTSQGMEVNSTPPSEVCTTTTVNRESKNKNSTEIPLKPTTTNNNNIEMPSPKLAQQAKLSPTSKSVTPIKEGISLTSKRPTSCSCPDGWKVKTIQSPDKQPLGRKFTCKRCVFSTFSHLTIESHIYSHIPGVQFRCAYCKSEFSSMAATASHIKNTHQLGEACLHISRYVEEHNFYDAEDFHTAEVDEDQPQAAGERVMGSPRGGTQVAGSVVVTGGDGAGQGGQSPPVVISVLVSSGAAATTAGGSHATGVMVRPGNVAPNSTTPPSASNRRRYVCTHCGFSTNVHADAEHHVSDLHPASSIFACTLCKENTFYSDAEIKQHAATVHPSRIRPYRRLPDFYDAEKLSTAVNFEDVVVEMAGSVFQDGHVADDSSPVDHRQRAKDYLHLQEGLKEKRSAEADSTTAVDYMECEADHIQDELADSAVSSQTEAEADTGSKEGENLRSKDSEEAGSVDAHCLKDSDLSDQTHISSSAACSSGTEKDAVSVEEESSHHGTTKSFDCPESHTSAAVALNKSVDGDGGDGASGLKIVEVVSLSSQEGSTQEGKLAQALDRRDEVCGEPQGNSGKNSDDSTEKGIPSSSASISIPAVETTATTTSSLSSSTSSVTTGSVPAAVSQTTAQTSAPAPSVVSNQHAGGLPLSYKCSACRVHTPYLLMMVKHLKAKHPHMGCFSCPYCKISAPSGDESSANQPESFVTQKQLRSHIRKFHPDKTGRNEIALSAKAKQFVEAMVLPAGPECIRVGNRLVLEEDIHTCTYCNLKMTSLASVYEHLNEVHADLFEFVCPICQSFKSKDLEAISIHSLEVHLSEVETDKVHVSVPKNLFSVLKCISKGGKYIEKHLDGTNSNAEVNSNSKTSTPTPSAVTKKNMTGSKSSGNKPSGPVTPAAACGEQDNSSAPLDLTSASQSINRAPAPAAAGRTPIIQAPPAHMAKPAQVNFSSSLFDTSSLSVPPQLVVSPVAGSSSTAVPAAAASSFLSPHQHKSTVSGKNQQPTCSSPAIASVGKQGGKHTKSALSMASKSLPVLNVPTIKPRPQPSCSAGARPRVPGIAEALSSSPQPELPIHVSRTPVISHTSSIASSSSAQSPQLAHLSLSAPATSFDDLPDDEPNPDAFKIFNLQPTPPLVNSPAPLSALHSPSSSTLPGIPSPSVVPTVFPPVSTTLNTGFIQGPIVGFPPGMVISQSLLPAHPASFSQQQQALFRSATPASTILTCVPSSLGSSSSGSGLSSKQRSSPSSFAQPQRPKSTLVASANTQLLKEQQKRELLLLKQQYQQQRQGFGGFSKESSQLGEDPQQVQSKEKQKQLRLQQLQFLHQARQQQQLAHRQQMLQRAVLNQQQQASNLAQQVQSQGKSYPPFQVSPQTWLQQQQAQHQHRHSQLLQQHKQTNQETLRQNSSDFSNAAHATQLNHPSRPSSSTTSASSSASASSGIVSPRPTKGVHKRSSSLYQCPYCPTPVTLKALDVASHIHQKHPGNQVVFKKAIP